MKGQIFVLLALLCLSTRVSASDFQDKAVPKNPPLSESQEKQIKKVVQSPYYENEFTQDAYYQASRDIASFKIEESK